VYKRQQYKIIQSRFLAGKVADKLRQLPRSSSLLPPGQSRKALIATIRGSISIIPVAGTRMFMIVTRGSDPKFVARLANMVAQAYIEQNIESQTSSAQRTISFLTDRLNELREKLRTSELTLYEFKEKQGTVLALKGKLDKLKNRLAEQLKKYKEKYPSVLELKSEIEKTEAKLWEEIARRGGQAGGRSRNPGGKSVGASFDKEQIQYSFLEREIDTNKQLYQILLQKLQEVNVSGEVATTNIRVIDPAQVPSTPIKPKKRLNLIFGALLGLVLGTGLAFFQEYLDTSLKSVEDIEERLGLPVLGLIPSIGTDKTSAGAIIPRLRARLRPALEEGRESALRSLHLISEEKPRSGINEAYRSLRTNLQFSSLDKPVRTILVTSGAASEGKSTTVANLGIALAKADKKVLLVDSDLRRPVLHKCFNLDNNKGLSNVLIEECSLDAAVKPTTVENLSLLTSGPIPPNPAEMVGSKKMHELINLMRGQFNIIVFDSPPAVAVTDAVVLASLMDGIILVIKAGMTPSDLCRRSRALLDKAKTPILGTVLNNITPRVGGYYYYYYHDRYYSYYTDEGEKKKKRKVKKSR
jgi:capsular exopolysaccharide synthesis family protein